MSKVILAILIGAGLGALIGYTQVFCWDGQCAMTGSWYGGSLLGGWIAGLLTCALALRTPAAANDAPPDPADPPSSQS